MNESGDRGRRMFRFGHFELDEQALELRGEGEPIPLQLKPLRLLVYLLENRERRVSKEELFRWWDAVVSDAAISSAVKDIRRALGDDPAAPRWIQTRRGVGYQFVGKVEVHLASDKVAHRSGLHGVPRGLSLSFVGRDAELLGLERLVTNESHVRIQAAVEGLAGIGKTELALQLVDRLARTEHFPGGIFWLDAEQTDLRSNWGTTIADGLGIAPGAPEDRCREVIRRLNETREGLLIVLDNVESWQADSQPMPIPHGPHVVLLVTTRDRNLGGAQFVHLELGFLTEPHDRELLQRVAGRDVGPGCSALLNHLGGYALGVELAGAFLGTYPSESAASYLNLLLERKEPAEREMAGRIRYERTVDDALQTIWGRLEESERKAWLLAACFEPEPASGLLTQAVGLDSADRRSLERRHLLRSTPDGSWVMHRLIQGFGRRSGSEEERLEARRRFAQGCLELVSYGLPSGRPWPAGDRAHLEAAVRIAPSVLDAESELRLLKKGAWLLTVHRGYVVDEVARIFSRAQYLEENSGRDDTALWATEGRWTHFAMRSRWDRAAEIAAEVVELATCRNAPPYRMYAGFFHGIVSLYTGRLHEASDALGSTIRLFGDGDVEFPPTPIAMVLMHHAMARCLLGFPDEALAIADEGLQIATREGDANLIATIAVLDSIVQVIRMDPMGIRRSAMQADHIAAAEGLTIFRRFTRSLLAWVAFSQGEMAGNDAISVIRMELQELDSIGFRLNRACLILLAVRIYCEMGALREGVDLLEDALGLMDETNERVMEAELLRSRASLAVDPDERIHWLERSLATAERQDAVLWALRASADLVEMSRGAAENRRAVGRLRSIYSRCGPALTLADILRTKRLLDLYPPA